MKEELLRERFKTECYAQDCGFILATSQDGHVSMDWEVREDQCNSNSVAAGMFVVGLLDTVSAYAAMSIVKDGEEVATTELNVFFLAPIVASQHIQGTVQFCILFMGNGKENVRVLAEARAEYGVVCAKSSAIFAVLSSERLKEAIRRAGEGREEQA